MVTEVDAYAKFRGEIDRMFFEKFSQVVNIFTEKDKEGNVIGMMIVDGDYIDGMWVDKEHRRKGIATNLVMQCWRTHTQPKSLHILNNNEPAKAFWNKIFYLQKIKETDYDTLYAILDLKGDF